MATEPTSTSNGQTNPNLATAAAAAAPQDAWDPTDAVEQVLGKIKEGSGLPLSKQAEDGLKQRYQPAFQQQLRKNVSFQVASETILPLAKVVGSVATVIAVFNAVAQNQKKLPPVDVKSALQAAELVAHLKFCPVDASDATRGNFCPPKDPNAHAAFGPSVQSFLDGVAALGV